MIPTKGTTSQVQYLSCHERLTFSQTGYAVGVEMRLEEIKVINMEI